MTDTETAGTVETKTRRSAKAEAASPAGPPAPPAPPVAAAAAAEPRRPGGPDFIPMRGFGPMPARLSPVNAGEIYVRAPSILRLGTVGGEFAFHPWDDSMAPFLGTRDLVYARHGTPVLGDLVFVMLSDGKPRLGFVKDLRDDGITLDANGTRVEIGPGELVECASVVLIHRNGRPEATIRVAAAKAAKATAAAATETGEDGARAAA